LRYRSVGTERFLRRFRWVGAVAVSNGDGGRTSKCGLVLLGSPAADTVARTIPELREVGDLADRGGPNCDGHPPLPAAAPDLSFLFKWLRP
jgi:hypothetical protein